jgi:hypothetical protein
VNPISRRTVLGGLGAGLALPWLEGMARAGGLSAATGAAAPVSTGGAPLRMLFVYVPNGVNLDLWTPAAEGPDFALPPTLAPLAKLRSEILVLSGLEYAQPILSGAHRYGWGFETPLAKKSIGQRLAWLKAQQPPTVTAGKCRRGAA